MAFAYFLQLHDHSLLCHTAPALHTNTHARHNGANDEGQLVTWSIKANVGMLAKQVMRYVTGRLSHERKIWVECSACGLYLVLKR